MVRWNTALIYTTTASYLACAVVTILGIPVIEDMPLLAQTLILITLGIGLSLTLQPRRINKQSHALLTVVMATIYGLLAPLSFVGIQKWINYYGTLSLGPYMTLWDIGLAIALLTQED